ncbi:MAG: SMP-30/gluconolactonase/LRE family protein [Usitatibacter sp.]
MNAGLCRALLSLAFATAGTVAYGASFSTLITTPLVIEGLTNDDQGNLYAPGRAVNAGEACPVWRVALDNPVLTVVGLVPAPSATGTCSPSGLAFGRDGNLYVTQTDRIYRFVPSATGTPPTATLFASGVPGTNGLAFDKAGNLWTGDGTTGLGRVWKITPQGVVTEVFRVQPMANEVNLVGGAGGVGRDVRSLPTGTITVTPTSRNAANTLGSQPLVANGLQFDRHGNLLIADTARGAIWKVRLHADGSVASRMGCDTTFTANTICLDSIFVAHPYLEGADGIVLDVGGRIWVAANERNAIVFVYADGSVVEVFRNAPDPVTQLRNTGPLETPTSPVLVGHKFCTANSDGNRRDNSPSTAGEIGGTGQPRGKISCLDQNANVSGVALPIQ